MKKCDYCAKEITYFDQYCCDECERLTIEFHERAEKYSRLFTIVNTICVFGIPAGLFLLSFSRVGAFISAISCIVLGIMLMVLPMPTEGMIRKHKLQKAIKINRIFGIAVMALSVLIMGLSFLIK